MRIYMWQLKKKFSLSKRHEIADSVDFRKYYDNPGDLQLPWPETREAPAVQANTYTYKCYVLNMELNMQLNSTGVLFCRSSLGLASPSFLYCSYHIFFGFPTPTESSDDDPSSELELTEDRPLLPHAFPRADGDVRSVLGSRDR